MATIVTAEKARLSVRLGGEAFAVLPLAIILLTSAVSVRLVLTTGPYTWVDTIYDDGYYYLGVARHLSLGAGSMFAPPLETNGYQPLWLLVLTAVSFVVGGDRTLLVAGTHIAILLVVLAFITIGWRQEGRQWPAALTVVCFSFAMLFGLETVLIAPLALLYFRADGWKRGALAGLLFLTRLDVLGLIIGRELYELLVRRRFELTPSVILAAVALSYASLNFYLLGTPVPISGLAKSVGNVPGENWGVGVLLASKAVPMMAALALVWRAKKQLRNPMPLFSCVVALGCSSAYYGIFSGWPIWDWYAWPRILLFYFVLIELIHCPPGLYRKAAVAALAFVFFTVPFTHLDRFKRGMSFGRDNVRLATQINSSTARGDTFAMGDRSGSFGYFLDDRFNFIQSEGLVANLAFLRSLKAEKGVEFLDAAGTDYFVVDRGKYWRFGSIYAIPEPSQGLSAHRGVMLLCFPESAEVRGLSITPERKIFSYPKRVECPPDAVALLRARQAQYRAVHENSRWPKPRTGFFDALE